MEYSSSTIYKRSPLSPASKQHLIHNIREKRGRASLIS
jgi:hypothetical protein